MRARRRRGPRPSRGHLPTVEGGRVQIPPVWRGPVAALRHLALGSAERWSGSPTLRRSFLAWAGLGLGLTVGSGAGAGVLGGALGLGVGLGAVWWLVASFALFLGLGLAVGYPDPLPLSRLGLPNGLTSVRAYMAVPILLFATMPDRFLARDLFLSVAAPVAVMDFLDGWVARRFGPVSLLGRALDPIMDAAFFSLCAVACLFLGLAPLWLVLLVVVRYGVPAVGFLVLYPWLSRRPDLVATRFGKVNTFASGVALAGSSLLVLSGGPALLFDLAIGAVLAATAVGQIATITRRALAELR